MDHILNDRGETVLAVGKPGSVERAQCERPEFLKRLMDYRNEQAAKGSATPKLDEEATVYVAQSLHEQGIVAEDEAISLLSAAGFQKDVEGDVLRQLGLINQDRDRMLQGGMLPVPTGPEIKAPAQSPDMSGH